MSLGFYGTCRLEAEDDFIAIYSYHGENWNLPDEDCLRLEPVEGVLVLDKLAASGEGGDFNQVDRCCGAERLAADTGDCPGPRISRLLACRIRSSFLKVRGRLEHPANPRSNYRRKSSSRPQRKRGAHVRSRVPNGSPSA